MNKEQLESALFFNPFEGDFGSCGDGTLKDKIVKFRKPHLCHICDGDIKVGGLGRNLVEAFEGDIGSLLLADAYRQWGVKQPWWFRGNQSLRTAVWMGRVQRPFEWIRHHALHDARHESAYLINILACFKRGLTGVSEAYSCPDSSMVTSY